MRAASGVAGLSGGATSPGLADQQVADSSLSAALSRTSGNAPEEVAAAAARVRNQAAVWDPLTKSLKMLEAAFRGLSGAAPGVTPRCQMHTTMYNTLYKFFVARFI